MAKSFKVLQNHDRKVKDARQAELNENTDDAIKLYEQIIASDYTDQLAFERLMVIYRKRKQFKDELRVINKGIDIFTQLNKRQLEENISKKKNKKEIEKLSNAFMKTSGLIDKKGKDVHIPEPINKWLKRKAMVEKRLKKI